MATIATLRTEAKKAGVAPSAIRAAESVKELEALIKRHGGGSSTGTNGRRAVKKSTTVRKSKPAATKATPTKRTGRKPAPAKGRTSPAKRQAAATTRKAAPKASAYEPKGGRNVLAGVNFSLTDGWNARTGSAPDTIIKALKKFRGDREKVYDYLVGDIGDFVKPKKRDGSKWAKGERENMLRYRIARTAWDFALKTGQHEKAENRVQYGTGGTGDDIWQPAKKAAPAKARTTTKTKPKAAPKRTTRTTTTRKPAAKPAARKTTTKPAAKTTTRRRAVRRSK